MSRAAWFMPSTSRAQRAETVSNQPGAEMMSSVARHAAMAMGLPDSVPA